MPQISLRCFGVGDGWPSADRDHSSFLYRFGDQAILVDCGESVSRSFKASGLDYDLIARVLISHLHFDHVGGFFMLMQSFWLEGRKRQLVVHAPEDGIAPIRKLLQAGCIFDELLPFPCRYEPWRAGQTITAGTVRITAFATSHLSWFREQFQAKYPQKYEAFSFLMESEHFRIGHSADIGAVEDLAPLVQQPLDVLVCELAHVPPQELFPFLKGRDIGRIIFIHLGRDVVENFPEVEALAKEILGPCPVHWPRGGHEFVFESAREGIPGPC